MVVLYGTGIVQRCPFLSGRSPTALFQSKNCPAAFVPPNVLYVRLSKRLASLQIPVFALTRVSVPLISDTADRPDQLLPRLPSCRKRGLHRRAQCIVDARLVTRPLAPIERQHVLVQTDRHDFLDGLVELAPHRAREPFIGQFGNVGEVDVFILDFGDPFQVFLLPARKRVARLALITDDGHASNDSFPCGSLFELRRSGRHLPRSTYGRQAEVRSPDRWSASAPRRSRSDPARCGGSDQIGRASCRE